ncbi:MAG: hydroxyacid dehydrogenase [Firmicutes bacterium]|nr:hydroxyacid dehydrogenase [Bacillota bacterium]
MKIVVSEALGVSREHIVEVCKSYVPGDFDLVIYEDRAATQEELLARCADADIIVEVNQPLNRELIMGCKNLKLIAVAFAGIDHIDAEACKEAGVKIANCPGYSASAVAELVFGLLTAVKRNLIAFDAETRAEGTRGGFVGTEIGGKNFGIVGFGHVGKLVAKIANAYGCNVFACTRTPLKYEGVTFLTLEELLKTCDIVSLNLPLTAESKGMIGEEQIAMMKDGAILINTARGPIVDSFALAKAVESGKLAGAGIDVFETEPPIDDWHVLFGSDRIVVAPHIGFATEEAFENRLHMSFKNIADFLA